MIYFRGSDTKRIYSADDFREKAQGVLMPEIPQISESEWEIMKLLWEEFPQSALSLIEKLKDKVEWKPKTVKSLISRLLKKGLISYNSVNRSYEYYPLYKKNECIQKESREFLDRVYSGQLDALFATYVDENKLNKKELEECRAILDKAIKKKK